MNMYGSKYIVDTNVLSQVGRERRASDFFRENAVIPDEVLHETKRFPDSTQLCANRYTTTPRVLELLVDVMATVPADDRTLVDLYKNLGGADPLVVACALAAREDESQYLDALEWVVVTGDRAVAAKAGEFGLDVIDTPTFSALIDEADDKASHKRNTPPVS